MLASALRDYAVNYGVSVGSSTVVVTNKEAYGKTLGQLNIPRAFGVIIRKIIRQGVELPHSFDLELKKGDILHAVGDKDKLLNNGDRWELEIARNIELDAPYR